MYTRGSLIIIIAANEFKFINLLYGLCLLGSIDIIVGV